MLTTETASDGLGKILTNPYMLTSLTRELMVDDDAVKFGISAIFTRAYKVVYNAVEMFLTGRGAELNKLERYVIYFAGIYFFGGWSADLEIGFRRMLGLR